MGRRICQFVANEYNGYMSKRKKINQTKVKRPLVSLPRQINEALAYWEDGDPQTCQRMLLELAQKYPRHKSILPELLEVSVELKDWAAYAVYGEQYLPLIPKREQEGICNNLAYAYIQIGYPAIVRHYARRVLDLSQDPELREQAEDMADKMELFLLEHMDQTLADLALDNKAKLSLMLKHDWVRFYTENHQPTKAIAVAQTIDEIAEPPIPVLNNLSLAYWQMGQMDEAIAAAAQVLTRQADNHHALSNLVRFHFVMGKFDEARQYLAPLMQIKNDNPELYFKKIEALAYLGDDKDLIAVYEELQKMPEKPSIMALSSHLAAAAYYRQNQPKKAWRLWREALKLQPGFKMAQASLADRNLPVGQWEIPWYLPLNYWVDSNFLTLLKRLLGKDTAGQTPRQYWKALIAERPHLPQLFPHILEKGDGPARNFIVGLLDLVEPPKMMPMLYAFACGRYGSDDIRMKAAQIVSRNAPELLPPDRMVTMWLNGKQSEIFMIAFQITAEPKNPPHLSEQIIARHEKAYELLQEGELDAAEEILNEIIAAESNFPGVHNHLAVIYERRGDKKKARELVEETHRRFPDYFFARIALSRSLCQENKIAEAEVILKPLMTQERLHISEFRALACAQMDLALAKELPETARSWLEMWREVEPDNPELAQWELRLTPPEDLLKRLSQMLFKK
jgi:tetratricopeptide (TPR) repeat protein